MKKLLGILVLGLLWCNVGLPQDINQIELPNLMLKKLIISSQTVLNFLMK